MSDPKRLGEVSRRISRIKEAQHPVVVGRDAPLRIEERPWKEVPEPSKLAILKDAIDWSGISNRDQGHILLSEVDPGRISDAQRNRLIDMATAGDVRGVPDGDGELLSPAGMNALLAQMDAEEQAARLAHAGEPDPMTYDARIAEAFRLRSEAPVPPSPSPSPELERIVDETVRQWQPSPSHDERLRAAAARMADKPKGLQEERGR